MKITKEYLQKAIKKEVRGVLNEQAGPNREPARQVSPEVIERDTYRKQDPAGGTGPRSTELSQAFAKAIDGDSLVRIAHSLVRDKGFTAQVHSVHQEQIGGTTVLVIAIPIQDFR